jgi:predicted acylesterase/phospholipase RssA
MLPDGAVRRGDVWSFSGGGWLLMYHLGVAAALQDTGVAPVPAAHHAHGKPRAARWGPQGAAAPLFVGSSAGAIVATFLATGVDMDAARISAAAMHQRLNTPLDVFSLRLFLTDALAAYRPIITADAAWREHLNARCRIYITTIGAAGSRLPLASAVYPAIETYDDVAEALLASSCATPFVGLPFRLRRTGEWAADGGFTNDQPRAFEPGVVTVSPFWWSRLWGCDVRPAPFSVPTSWSFFPPPKATYATLYDRGYNDALAFLAAEGAIGREEVAARRRVLDDTHVTLYQIRGAVLVAAAVYGGARWRAFRRDARALRAASDRLRRR